MVVDEELNQNPACGGDTLAVMPQNGKKVFVLSHPYRYYTIPFINATNFICNMVQLSGKLWIGLRGIHFIFMRGVMNTCKEWVVVS